MTTVRPYRSSAPARRGDFAQLLHAEWTKFRTVRGWVTGMIVAVLVIVGFGLFASGGGVKASGSKACPPGVSGVDCRSAAVSLPPPENTIALYLIGTFAGLIAVAVVATMFMSAEYRKGLIRTTLAASPVRGRVLTAKAIVIGAVAFAVQQPTPQYYLAVTSPATGFFPLAPWAGFAVLCGWTVLALVLAAYLLRRRDA